jgi:tetratricopeptide (TPR) repeat protein
MALLDEEKYAVVIFHGKQAVKELNNNNIKEFSIHAENGWESFPNPKNNWNQGYNYAKMIYRGFSKNKLHDQAKVWLNRMIDNNNNLHLEDEEVWFETAKYHFEIREYNESLEKFKKVVEVDGFRYFEDEDPKYLDFYKNPDKYIKS